MNQPELKEYRRLKRAGYDVSKAPTFSFNAGSGETIVHAFGKLVSAYVGLESGYKADCEVAVESGHGTMHGELDVLLYAPDRINRVVEIETDITEDVVADKRARYVEGSPVIDEMHVIEATDLPANVYDMRDAVYADLGLF